MRSRPLAERFWEKVDVGSPSECWEWTAAKDKCGYGVIKVARKMKKAHRVSYELNNGLITQGLDALHSCHNPGCVNPSHIRIGTNAENVKDKMLAGREYRKLSRRDISLVKQMALRFSPSCKPSEIGFGVQTFLARWFRVDRSHVSHLYSESLKEACQC